MKKTNALDDANMYKDTGVGLSNSCYASLILVKKQSAMVIISVLEDKTLCLSNPWASVSAEVFHAEWYLVNGARCWREQRRLDEAAGRCREGRLPCVREKVVLVIAGARTTMAVGQQSGPFTVEDLLFSVLDFLEMRCAG